MMIRKLLGVLLLIGVGAYSAHSISHFEKKRIKELQKIQEQEEKELQKQKEKLFKIQKATVSDIKEENTPTQPKKVNKENTKLEIKGRHDPCIVPRAVPVVEEATAIALCDMLLDK